MTERVVVAPTEYIGEHPALFLAGGITDCPDWRADAVRLLRLAGIDWVILDPQRPAFTLEDKDAAAEQAGWEFRHLSRAQVIMFWFPRSDSVQPIALYELGAHAARRHPLAVGADLDYPRRLDVVLQMSHARPGLEVRSTLDGTVADAVRLCRDLVR